MLLQLKTLFPSITDKQIEQFDKLVTIFPIWNEKINLISRKDIENLFVNHILHSLSILKKIELSSNSRIIDVGTGGGFPGIPIAIMRPDIKFDLVDSIGKKINVVNQIIEELNLQNAIGIKSRAELLPQRYHYVISRAVTSFPEFYKIVKNLFAKDKTVNNKGIIYLKGGNFEQEIKSFNNIKVYDIKNIFDIDFFETKKIIYCKVS